MSCIRGLVLTQLQTDMDRSVRKETLSDRDSDANSTDKAACGEEREQSIRRTLDLDRLRPRRAAHTDDLRSPPTTSVVLNDPCNRGRHARCYRAHARAREAAAVKRKPQSRSREQTTNDGFVHACLFNLTCM